ncbi:hypothetical protein ACPF3S_003191 [Vibrio cholerae]|uniref:Uncharacterized protein n=1 Tax=Vibrio cholerae TaxID=666 RepID=A0A7Z7VLL0_VIBCL|nr:hypothetical protein [Vibrio cholerae]EII3729063.1 hypothetical protein [Vibrio cholerae]EKF9501411.1 hypothetical protein [Vibrio cholerae]ELH0870625.1 hypothetical protein [Vibrio cholerae]PNV69079.1 hypothetical protein C1Y48_20220 [Vibrio cholerae]TBM41318.1 hypothetical protein EYB64_12145 [Vibrio cholerae]
MNANEKNLSMTETQQIIFNKGFHAYYCGGVNPYNGTGKKWWNLGWEAAKEEMDLFCEDGLLQN